MRATLAVREALVRTRTRYVALVRALLRREGIAVPSGSAEAFGRRVAAVAVPARLQPLVAPVLTLLAPIEAALATIEQELAQQLAAEPATPWLQSVRGVGPVTAAAMVATLDTPTRFASAKHVAGYLGLAPSERSSADRQHRGGITKTGNRRTRGLLVQAAWVVWRDRHPDTALLRAWATRVAARRGKRVMVVALARRLATIVFALWRDGTTDARRLERPARATREIAA
jgi:transposase